MPCPPHPRMGHPPARISISVRVRAAGPDCPRPSISEWGYTMSFVRSADDIRLYVEDQCPAGASIQTVVFVHGWPFDNTLFEYQTTTLVGLGYRCVGIDLRGFGRSGSNGRGYDYNQLSDDLYRAIRMLNLRHFTLVGFSMGAGVCARYMRRHQGYCVDQLCFIGGALPQLAQSVQNPCGVPSANINQLLCQLDSDRPGTIASFVESCYNQSHSRPFLDWCCQLGFRSDSLAVSRCLMALRDENCRSDLAAITVPTAIFHGYQDKICPVGMAELTQQLIPGCQLYIYPDSGHCVHLDQRNLFDPHFVAFITKT